MPKKHVKTFSCYEQALQQAAHKVATSARGRTIIWKELDSGSYAVSSRLPKDNGRWMVAADFKDGCYYHD